MQFKIITEAFRKFFDDDGTFLASGLAFGRLFYSVGFLKGERYLILDRDPLYTQEFLNMLAEVGIQSVKLPPRSPNLNVYAERFVRSIKESCLEQMILFSEDSLRNGIRHFWTTIILREIIKAWKTS